MKTLYAVFTLLLLICSTVYAAVDTTLVNVLSYAGTNVTTSAYVTLVSSTPISVGRLQICDTSTQVLKIASGSSGNEQDLVAIGGVAGCVTIAEYIPAGVRLSIKAISASATTGFNTVSFLK